MAVAFLVAGLGTAAAEDLRKPLPAEMPPDSVQVEPMPEAAGTLSGEGQVLAVDRAAGLLTVAQEPVPTLGWPSLTVRFDADPALLDGLAPGAWIVYSFRSAGGVARIERLQRR
ncbi:copper-binding protein [Stutzerimonas azotifigens]|uniref:copper-binding protein n=1 Tax=Stutzerimonas azotifigens TaxID=291995 RepID=UPI000425EF74|nr:copper-binding protein [Stutzerimonas azotifigens]